MRKRQFKVLIFGIAIVLLCTIIFAVTFINHSMQNNGYKVITQQNFTSSITNNLASVLKVDLSQIDNAKISSGSASFSRSLSKEETQEFLKVFDGVEFTDGALLQSRAAGFTLGVCLYEGDKQVAFFDFEYDSIRIKNPKDNTTTYYHSSKNVDDKQIEAIIEKFKLAQKYKDIK